MDALETELQKKIEGTLEQIIVGKDWGYKELRKVLLVLGRSGPGHFLPGRLRPETVHVQGLREALDETRKTANEKGVTCSRAVAIDTGKFDPAMENFGSGAVEVSGRTLVDRQRTGRVEFTPRQGRELMQHMMMSIRARPDEVTNGFGLYPEEFVDFLSDKRQVATVVACKEGTVMVIKTSNRQVDTSREVVKRKVDGVVGECLNTGKGTKAERFAEYTQRMCLDNGLVLMVGYAHEKDMLTRRDVTQGAQ
jgi:hypothetical protein